MSDINCMFQYSTRYEILADTDLMTQEEALALFDKNKSDFVGRLDKDEQPQMCIWIDCDTNASYGNTLFDWCADDFKIIDGELYQKV